MLAIILLVCRTESCCADLVLVACCFISQEAKVTRMRHLQYIVPVLIVTCIGTPLMLMQWVESGTGNANFVFFLCLGTVLSIVISIVEFTRSAMSQRYEIMKSKT